LLPNVNVGVTIVAAEHDNVLTLQRDALHTDDSKVFVYRIVNGHLKRQSVEISLQNLTRVEITAGLTEGAQVALSAEESKPLFDGAAVKVVP
jgi:HlyD family secretion protein